MGFAENLGTLRRQKGYTQVALADAVGVTSNQLSRYELGLSEPSLAVVRKLAVALSVSLDTLVFGNEGRVSDDDALRLAFESSVALDPEEREIVVALLEAFVARHKVRRGGEGPRAPRKKKR